MPRNSDKADSPRKWINNARGDLAIARIDLPMDATYEMLCFHAQQAAEKSVKALLLHLKVDFPFTHSIQLLVSMLPSDIQSMTIFRDAAILTPYAVLTRYPGEMDAVTEDKYLEAVHIASAVVNWVEDYISNPS